MTMSMNPVYSPLTRSLLCLSMLGMTAILAAGCEAAMDDDSSGELGATTGLAELRAQVEDLAERTQELDDRRAIRAAAMCYGRGHDEVFRHLQGDQREALAILADCHTDDVETDVFFFDETTPAAQLASLEELVGFIEEFAVMSNYTSARNIVGDIRVDFTGPDTAISISAAAVPHFITNPDNPSSAPTVDVGSVRYIDEMVRGADGVWRIAKKSLIVDEFWRGTGFYPFQM